MPLRSTNLPSVESSHTGCGSSSRKPMAWAEASWRASSRSSLAGKPPHIWLTRRSGRVSWNAPKSFLVIHTCLPVKFSARRTTRSFAHASPCSSWQMEASHSARLWTASSMAAATRPPCPSFRTGRSRRVAKPCILDEVQYSVDRGVSERQMIDHVAKASENADVGELVISFASWRISMAPFDSFCGAARILLTHPSWSMRLQNCVRVAALFCVEPARHFRRPIADVIAAMMKPNCSATVSDRQCAGRTVLTATPRARGGRWKQPVGRTNKKAKSFRILFLSQNFSEERHSS